MKGWKEAEEGEGGSERSQVFKGGEFSKERIGGGNSGSSDRLLLLWVQPPPSLEERGNEPGLGQYRFSHLTPEEPVSFSVKRGSYRTTTPEDDRDVNMM